MSLQRLLVNRIEQRILVGTVAFLATLVLVGWIAINEGGRMAAFDKEFTGRSIEEIDPLWIGLLDQAQLPKPVPFLELLLARWLLPCWCASRSKPDDARDISS